MHWPDSFLVPLDQLIVTSGITNDTLPAQLPLTASPARILTGAFDADRIAEANNPWALPLATADPRSPPPGIRSSMVTAAPGSTAPITAVDPSRISTYGTVVSRRTSSPVAALVYETVNASRPLVW